MKHLPVSVGSIARLGSMVTRITAGAVLCAWFTVAPGALQAQDYALRFGYPTSATTYVRIPWAATLAFRAVTGYTVEAFIKIEKMPDGNEDLTVANIFGCASRLDLYLRADGALTCRLNLASDQYFTLNSSVQSWNLGQWYHVAASWDPANSIIRLFRDGQMIGSVATTGNSFGNDILFTDARSIGGLRYPWQENILKSCQFYGVIDEVRVSTVARYTSDFTVPRNPFVRDQYTVGLWHCNEGAGTTVADDSAHGHTGTVVGTYAWVPGYFVGLDTTPPAAVTLSAVSQQSSVLLTWTAPGDDGNTGDLSGARYYIQYSTYAGVTWSTASAQITITTTTTQGAPQSRLITGLTGGVTYYFRLWTADEVPNLSAPSNTASTWAGNAPPVCTITSPSNGQGFAAPANVTITASASDSDGVVVQVEFFTGTTSLGVDTASPWSYTWSNISSGTYVLSARATDTYGGVGVSSNVTINVNQAPTVTLTAPSALTLITSGTPIGARTNGDGTTTTKIVGAPMRDFDLNITTRLQKSSETLDGIVVNSYYDPAHAEMGKQALRFALEALRVFQARFGAYPYAEFDLVEAPITALGIEYPGVIVLAQSMYENTRQLQTLEFVVAHEIAHQWWYNLVGNDQVNHPWVDEALAQYSEVIYTEELHGAAAAQVQSAAGELSRGAETLRAQVERFLAEMKAASADYQALVYNLDVHSFTPPGPGYNADADRDSWPKTLAFFGKYLGRVSVAAN